MYEYHLVLFLLTHYAFEILVLVLHSECPLDLLLNLVLIVVEECLVTELTRLLPPLLVILHLLLHLLHMLSEILTNFHAAVVIGNLLFLSFGL